MALLTLKMAKVQGSPTVEGSRVPFLAKVGSGCSDDAISTALLKTNVPSSRMVGSSGERYEP